MPTTRKFAPFGVARPGIPLFFDDRMKLLEAPTLWLAAVAQRGRSNRPNTWKAYGADLLDFLRFCEATNIDYLDPVRGLLAAYRDQMLSRKITRCGVEKRPATSTINRRIHSAAAFYIWMLQNGIVDRLPFRNEDRASPPRDSDKLAHVRKGRKRPGNDASMPPDVARVPIALDLGLIRRIFDRLRERDAIIAALLVSTGSRIDEILALNLDQIPNDQRLLDRKSIAIFIHETKGLKPRDIFVPLPILSDLNRYIYGERARVVRDLRKRGETFDDKAVFLSVDGLRLAYRTFWETFRAAANAEASTARIHDLRHTYAIYTLAHLQRATGRGGNGGSADPLVTLQHLLGHRYLSSTGIYLRALTIDPHVAEDAMESYVDQWWDRR